MVNRLVILFDFLRGVVKLRCWEVALGVLKLCLHVKWKTIAWSFYETLLQVSGLTITVNKSIFVSKTRVVSPDGSVEIVSDLLVLTIKSCLLPRILVLNSILHRRRKTVCSCE